MYHTSSPFLVQTKQCKTSTMLRESSASATTPVTIRTYSSISPPIVFLRHYSCNTWPTAAPATNATAIEAVTGNKNHISHSSFFYHVYHSLLMQHIRRHRTSHKRSYGCSRYRYVKPHIPSLLSQVISLSLEYNYGTRKPYWPKTDYCHRLHPLHLLYVSVFRKPALVLLFYSC